MRRLRSEQKVSRGWTRTPPAAPANIEPLHLSSRVGTRIRPGRPQRRILHSQARLVGQTADEPAPCAQQQMHKQRKSRPLALISAVDFWSCGSDDDPVIDRRIPTPEEFELRWICSAARCTYEVLSIDTPRPCPIHPFYPMIVADDPH